MNFLSFIGDIFKPAADLIDELHTSEEERLTLKQHFFQIQASLYAQAMELEARVVEAQAKIVTAEATSEGWLTRNWRPVTMMIFVAMIVARWFGFSAPGMSEQEVLMLWELVKYGLTGYVVGRSAEKIIPSVADAIGKITSK